MYPLRLRSCPIYGAHRRPGRARWGPHGRGGSSGPCDIIVYNGML